MVEASFGSDELATILRNYPFFGGKIDVWRKIPQKLYNHNYCIEIDGKSWVVKCYPHAVVTSRLKLSHQVQLALQDEGFPVAFLELTKNRSSFVDIDGLFFSVHRWVSGKHFSPFKGKESISDEVISEVALSLAKMHRIVSISSLAPQDATNTLHGEYILQRPIAFCDGLMRRRGWRFSHWNRLRFKYGKSKFDKWVVARLPFLVEISKGIKKHASAEEAFVWGEKMPTHNDVNWENMIFDDKGKLLALIDFDNLIYAPRLYEVGAAAIVIAGPDELKIKKFIKAYNSAYGDVCSGSVVWVAMVSKCLSSLFFSIKSYLDGKAKDLQVLQSWCFYLDQCLHLLLSSKPFVHFSS